MTIRKFVAGDRVQKRSGGPIMIVQKYCLRQHVFGGILIVVMMSNVFGTKTEEENLLFLTNAPCLKFQFFRHHPMSIITLVTLVNLAFQHKNFRILYNEIEWWGQNSTISS